MLDKATKQKIINKFKIHPTDTGSTQVQIAILTEEIRKLTDHLKSHKHDNSSRRGLIRKVCERRQLLKYLQKDDKKSFNEIATRLKLKIAKKMIADEEEKKRLEELMMNDEFEKVSEGEEEKTEEKTEEKKEE